MGEEDHNRWRELAGKLRLLVGGVSRSPACSVTRASMGQTFKFQNFEMRAMPSVTSAFLFCVFPSSL